MADSSHVSCGESDGYAEQENRFSAFSDEASRLFLLNGIEFSAIVFRGPTVPICQALLSEGVPQLVAACPDSVHDISSVAESAGSDECVAHPSCMGSALESLTQVSHQQGLCESLEPAYVKLFVTNKDGVPAPPYASYYSEGRMMGQAAIAMKERLEAAGLTIGATANEPPDHVSIMLEYLYYLLSNGWHQNDPIILDAAGEYLRDDILPWYSAFSQKITEHDETGFFAACATFTDCLFSLLTRTSA